MNKILLFARDPGGANTIIPLVKPLRAKGYELLISGKDVALKKFEQNGIKAIDINSVVEKIDQVAIFEFIAKEKPDFIITGTSADDMTEKFLWKASEEMKIPSFAILDQWVNYGIRFSRFSVSDIHKFKKCKELEYLPSKILVMDEIAEEEAAEEGIPREKILISGQPYFQQILEKNIEENDLHEIKKKFNIKGDDFVVVFASEPIKKIYKNNYWGYDELTIFSRLLEALEKYSEGLNKRIILIVKLHPKEDRSFYENFFKKYKEKNVKIVVDESYDSSILISVSNLVCGMSSMFLLESMIIGKPTVSIQIGLRRKNPFILDRIGVLKSVLEQDKLVEEIEKITQEKKSSHFFVVEKPVEKIINFMEQMICQN